MNRTIECNSCHKNFGLDERSIKTVNDGDYEVQYFVCPHCHAKYQIITTDTKMRDIIQKRKQLRRKFQLVQKKHFRESTLRTMQKEDLSLKAECESMVENLKKIGEEILRKDENNGV